MSCIPVVYYTKETIEPRIPNMPEARRVSASKGGYFVHRVQLFVDVGITLTFALFFGFLTAGSEAILSERLRRVVSTSPLGPSVRVRAAVQPFEGDYTQEMFAQQMIDEYRTAGIKPDSVWVQSYELDDIEVNSKFSHIQPVITATAKLRDNVWRGFSARLLRPQENNRPSPVLVFATSSFCAFRFERMHRYPSGEYCFLR